MTDPLLDGNNLLMLGQGLEKQVGIQMKIQMDQELRQQERVKFLILKAMRQEPIMVPSISMSLVVMLMAIIMVEQLKPMFSKSLLLQLMM